jgi:hypothetical protein
MEWRLPGSKFKFDSVVSFNEANTDVKRCKDVEIGARGLEGAPRSVLQEIGPLRDKERNDRLDHWRLSDTLSIYASKFRIKLYSSYLNSPYELNHNQRLATIELYPSSTFTRLEVSPAILRACLHKHADIELTRFISEMFKVGDLQLNDFSELARFEHFDQRMKNLKTLLLKRQQNLPEISNESQINALAVNVKQGTAAAITSPTPCWMYTRGLGPCFSVGLISKKGVAQCHLDEGDGSLTVQQMGQRLNLDQDDKIFACIAGGDRTRADLLLAYEELLRWQNEGIDIKIVVGRILKSEQKPSKSRINTDSLILMPELERFGRIIGE